MGLFTTTPVSILPSDQSNAGAIQSLVAQIQAVSPQISDPSTASLFNIIGEAMTSMQSQSDTINNALREPLPFPETVAVTDPEGNLIAWIGYQVVGQNNYEGIWTKDLYVGGTSPQNALVTVLGGELEINDGTVGFVNTAILTDSQIELQRGSTTILLDPVGGTVSFISSTSHFEFVVNASGLFVGNTSTSANTAMTPSGFAVNGTPGITQVLNVPSLNTLTVSGGIITAYS
jgi:hypothetical protein